MTATVTCPLRGHQALETMPTDACQFFYECKGCRRVLQPKRETARVLLVCGSTVPAQTERAQLRWLTIAQTLKP